MFCWKAVRNVNGEREILKVLNEDAMNKSVKARQQKDVVKSQLLLAKEKGVKGDAEKWSLKFEALGEKIEALKK